MVGRRRSWQFGFGDFHIDGVDFLLKFNVDDLIGHSVISNEYKNIKSGLFILFACFTIKVL